MMVPARIALHSLLVGVVALSLFGLTGGRETRAAHDSAARVVYVALGDSLTSCIGVDDTKTECYPGVLARRLPHGAATYNLGLEGETAESAVSDELPQALAVHPTLVTIELGANDIGNGNPAHAFKTAINQLLTALQGKHVHIFILNLPNFAFVPGDDTPKQDVITERAFNAAIAALAARHGATVVDLYAQTKSIWGHPDLLFPDGLHLDAQGYSVLAGLLYRSMHSHGAL